MKNQTRLKLVSEREDYKIFEFKPSVFKLTYAKIERMYFARWLRMLLFTITKKSAMYYLFYNETPIGYVMLTRGKTRHYEFLSAKDAVVGPLYILTEHRGKGLSYYLMETAMQTYKEDYGCEKIYGYCWKTNVQSNKMLLRLGYSVCGNVYQTKFTRSVKNTDESTMYQLYVR